MNGLIALCGTLALLLLLGAALGLLDRERFNTAPSALGKAFLTGGSDRSWRRPQAAVQGRCNCASIY